jgi:uncharacterized protein (DUF1684 family)
MKLKTLIKSLSKAQAKLLLWTLACLVLVAFRADDPAYREQLDGWHRQRIESLKSENGWLNLAGLYWLKEGSNDAGTDPGNDLTFPAGVAPSYLGVFHLVNGVVQFDAAPGVVVEADGQPLLETKTIFAPDLKKPVTLTHGSLRWFVIKRGDRYAVRLRDLDSPLLKEFTGIDRFPADESWRVKARLERLTQPRTIPILDVTGQISQQPLLGTLVFERNGQRYRLDAVGEGSTKLFILFGDQTNTTQTYGSGRFLYADLPGPDGLTTLDFNQAINPPCAFTPFATCPIPPKQNRLAVAVQAGEKRYGDH